MSSKEEEEVLFFLEEEMLRISQDRWGIAAVCCHMSKATIQTKRGVKGGRRLMTEEEEG